MHRTEHFENYLLLIDEKQKAFVDGELLLCVNPQNDCWQPADSVPMETLKKLAVTSVAARMETLPSDDELRAFYRLYGL